MRVYCAAILERIDSGQVDIVVGTHALLAPKITFANLGLVVVDEEQRFGVNQVRAEEGGGGRRRRRRMAEEAEEGGGSCGSGLVACLHGKCTTHAM